MREMNRRELSVLAGKAMLLGLAGVAITTPALAEHDDRWYREHHPKIHEAIVALKAAREELDKAGHDYGGHKRESIEAIDKALHELGLAREFDRH